MKILLGDVFLQRHCSSLSWLKCPRTDQRTGQNGMERLELDTRFSCRCPIQCDCVAGSHRATAAVIIQQNTKPTTSYKLLAFRLASLSSRFPFFPSTIVHLRLIPITRQRISKQVILETSNRRDYRLVMILCGSIWDTLLVHMLSNSNLHICLRAVDFIQPRKWLQCFF